MRCTADVTEQQLIMRAHGQHQAPWREGDPSARCRREADRLIDGHWLCEQHYPQWLKDHRRILKRILAIPSRPVL